jgi:hypothetical protein
MGKVFYKTRTELNSFFLQGFRILVVLVTQAQMQAGSHHKRALENAIALLFVHIQLLPSEKRSLSAHICII